MEECDESDCMSNVCKVSSTIHCLCCSGMLRASVGGLMIGSMQRSKQVNTGNTVSVNAQVSKLLLQDRVVGST